MSLIEFWNNKPLRNKTILVLVIIIFVVILLFQRGFISLDYFDKVEKEKQVEIERLIKERDSLRKVYLFEIDSIKNIKTEINSYYEDYIRKSREVERLQNKINNIRYTFYGKRSLDSIAEHVKYK